MRIYPTFHFLQPRHAFLAVAENGTLPRRRIGKVDIWIVGIQFVCLFFNVCHESLSLLVDLLVVRFVLPGDRDECNHEWRISVREAERVRPLRWVQLQVLLVFDSWAVTAS